MKPPFRLPTERFGLSVGFGGLISFSMLFAASSFPEAEFNKTMVFSPFVCGFAGTVIFGAKGRHGVGLTLPIGVVAYLAYFFLINTAGLFCGLWLGQPSFAGLLYLSFFPPFFLAALILSVIGAIFGWMAALAIQR